MQKRSLLKIVLESFLVSTLGRLFAAHFLSHTRSVVFMICDKMIFRNIDIFIHKCYFKRMNHTIHQLSNEEKKCRSKFYSLLFASNIIPSFARNSRGFNADSFVCPSACVYTIVAQVTN